MEKVYKYDAMFYDRRFMNCGQRHAIVLLARRGVPVNYLFCSAWVASDMVYEQVVVGKRPKFAFESAFYAAQDLASVGVTPHEVAVDTYADIAGLVDAGIARQGFVLLSGDVFYFAHCPEFRTAHAPHIVVLEGRDGAGDWRVIDDNTASVLCEYTYPAAVVEAFFDNNVDRKLRWFDVAAVADRAQLRAQALRRLADVFSSQADTYRLYDEVRAILANPYDSLAIKLKALHDAFCLLSGARNCLAGFLRDVGAPDALVADMRAFAEQAAALKGMMVKAQITSRIDAGKLDLLCAGLKARDQANVAGLARYLDCATVSDDQRLDALAPVSPG
jgi:hypothetical protein